jgi:predicted nucleic acid-binding protein
MIKTVIDTSTLISLARISYLELLPKLRKSVVLPHEVYEEAVIKGEEKGIADAIVIKGFIKNDGFAKSRHFSIFVIPAKAGIQ